MSNTTVRPKTPVQQQLDQLGSQLIKASSATCVAIFGIGLLRGYDRLVMFKSAISLAIAAAPEGLPAVATTSLARGIHRMRERNVLIRHLHAVATIGAIRTICLDKIGTLTRNVMSAVAIGTLGPSVDPATVAAGLAARLPELQRLLQVCVLCSQSESEDGQPDRLLQGSATENALIDLAAKAGITPALRDQFPFIDTELRAEGRNFMRTVHHGPDGARLVAVEGSPQEVLALCGSAPGTGPAALAGRNRPQPERYCRHCGRRGAAATGQQLGKPRNQSRAATSTTAERSMSLSTSAAASARASFAPTPAAGPGDWRGAPAD